MYSGHISKEDVLLCVPCHYSSLKLAVSVEVPPHSVGNKMYKAINHVHKCGCDNMDNVQINYMYIGWRNVSAKCPSPVLFLVVKAL